MEFGLHTIPYLFLVFFPLYIFLTFLRIRHHSSALWEKYWYFSFSALVSTDTQLKYFMFLSFSKWGFIIFWALGTEKFGRLTSNEYDFFFHSVAGMEYRLMCVVGEHIQQGMPVKSEL